MQPLLNYFNKIHPISKEAEGAISNISSEISIPKNKDLQSRGHTCKTIYFITKGIGRIYYYKDGIDITRNFFFENNIIARIEARTMLPYHPFDYLYNYAVRHLFSKFRILHRTAQGRFACGVAFVWLTTIILFLYNGYFVTGKILGGILVIVGALVNTIDICIPSLIYNLLFRKAKQS